MKPILRENNPALYADFTVYSIWAAERASCYDHRNNNNADASSYVAQDCINIARN